MNKMLAVLAMGMSVHSAAIGAVAHPEFTGSFGYTTMQAAAPTRTLVSAYLHASANTMVKGDTLQFSAYGVYSDGSVTLLPDAEGNAVTAWHSSDRSLARVSRSGDVRAVGAGKVDIQAIIGGLYSSVWTVTISPPAADFKSGAVAPAPPTVAVPPSQESPSEPSPEISNLEPGLPPPAEPATPEPATPEPNVPEPYTPESSNPQPADTPAPAAPAPSPPGPAGPSSAGPAPAAPGPALPDGFTGPFWRLQTPAGGSASISNSHLFLGVPGGANHDPLPPSNQAVRLMQEIGNQDFDVSIKIDSPLVASDANSGEGLMVLADNENFITFGLTTDGNNVGMSVHTVTHGAAATILEDTDFSQYQNPMYLQLSRTGSTYLAQYSVDGVSWSQVASFTYLTPVAAIGPYASNYNANPASTVPVVMSVNWFDVQQ